MKTNDSNEQPLFSAGSTKAVSNGWIIWTLFPFLRTLWELREERLHPPQHVEITAAPVEVEELWTKPKNHIAGLLSLLAHVSVVSIILVLSIVSYKNAKAVTNSVLNGEQITLSLPPASAPAHGGGGGGTKAPTKASIGVLPKASTVQLVPPTTTVTQIPPELAAQMTVIIPELANRPAPSPLLAIGDPNGIKGPPSNGTGTGAGIGDGNGHGIGSGDGPGVGPGSGGGTNGGSYRAGGTAGLTNPQCTTVEPNFSDAGRKAHIQGDVVLDVVIQKDGSISVSKVLKSLGYGMDEEAQLVLKKWKCSPGKLKGEPVNTETQIVINFRLL